MEERYTFKAEGIEITGTRDRLEELVSCISFEKEEPSNSLADIVSEMETAFDLK